MYHDNEPNQTNGLTQICTNYTTVMKDNFAGSGQEQKYMCHFRTQNFLNGFINT